MEVFGVCEEGMRFGGGWIENEGIVGGCGGLKVMKNGGRWACEGVGGGEEFGVKEGGFVVGFRGIRRREMVGQPDLPRAFFFFFKVENLYLNGCAGASWRARARLCLRCTSSFFFLQISKTPTKTNKNNKGKTEKINLIPRVASRAAPWLPSWLDVVPRA